MSNKIDAKIDILIEKYLQNKGYNDVSMFVIINCWGIFFFFLDSIELIHK